MIRVDVVRGGGRGTVKITKKGNLENQDIDSGKEDGKNIKKAILKYFL